MNSHLALERLLSGPVVERFGWALVHSLWQFALVTIVAGAIVRTMRQKSSAARYGVLVVAMALSVTAPVATCVLQPGDTPDHSVSRGAAAADASVLAADPILASDTKGEYPNPDLSASSVVSEMPTPASPPSRPKFQYKPSWSEHARAVLQPWLAWIVAGWSLGVVLCSLRPLLGWHTLRRLQRVGVSPASDEVLSAMRRVSKRLGLRHVVRVGQSTLTQVPLVVGYLRPVVLLPVSLVTSMPVAQLEAILAHELAHVRRHDFVANLLQALVETLFFYHPAVWWLSHQIRVEREHCCDDLVVKLLDNRVEYGRALVAVEQLRGRSSVFALGATDGSLLSRVRRIVGRHSDPAAVRLNDRWPVALLSLASLGVALALSMSWSLAANAVIISDTQDDKKPTAGADARAEKATATVVGTVVSPDGKPVGGIEVLAFEGGKQLEPKFTTDERGEFRVPKAWRDVDHWLTVVARDGRERLGWFDFMIHGHSDLGQKSEDGSFRLVLLPMSRTIHGRIVDEAGQPLAEIPVWINQLEHEVNLNSVHWRHQKLGDEPLVLGAVSDSGGRFELTLPADTFAWLGAAQPDWVEKQIRATSEKDELADTRLVRAAKVAGRVIDSRTGRPLAGVTIGADATKTEIFESGGADAKTDVNGNYLIQGLRGGEHTIRLLEGADKTLTAPAYAKAMLKSGETFQADFSLSVGKRLTGRVVDIDTGEPIPNCKVRYNGPAHPAAGKSTETNTLGEFVFFLPPGRSTLDATEGRRFGNDSTRTVDVPADGNPAPVVLKVGEKTEPVPGSFKIFIGLPLDRKVSLRIKDTPLAEALKEVCESADMKLELDQAALTGAGYSKDTPVNLFEPKPVTLKDALTLILKPYEKLSFAVDKNQVLVSIRAGDDQQAGVEPQALADESIALADAVREFNAENEKRGRGRDQPPLTENEVVAAIERSNWKRDAPDVSEREFAAFKAVASTRRLPKGSEVEVLTGLQTNAFTVIHLWSIRINMPALERAGTFGFAIRDTKLGEDRVDPKSVAWGKPDADGLSLGAYLSPKKQKYALGERVRLRLFVRNEGRRAVETSFANTSHPGADDFIVTDQNDAQVAVRIGHDDWAEAWVSGSMAGRLGPGDVHAFHVPFEVGIGGDGTNKSIGRVIEARAGQTLRLRVRSSTGSNRTRTDDEPETESGALTFTVEAAVNAPPADREAAVAAPETPEATTEAAANGEIASFTPMFSGQDLAGWVNINCAPGTFLVTGEEVITTGNPTGFLRTARQYENFVLEFDWMHVNTKEVGNSGVFVWGDALPAVGTPYTRGIEVQVLVNLEYKDLKTGAITATSHGDLFSIWGAKCTPYRPHPLGWERCLPSENHAKGGGEWNHYKVVADDGTIRLAVNGTEVSGVSKCSPRKGYLALESEGAECHFRNVMIRELPTTNPQPAETAKLDEGHKSLFNGLTLDGWTFWTPPGYSSDNGWKAAGGRLMAVGTDFLSTEKEFGPCELILDWKLPATAENPECIVSIGGQKRTLHLSDDTKPGSWQRQTLKVEKVAGPAPIQILPATGLEVMNLFVRELKSN